MREGLCWALCVCAMLVVSCRDKCLNCSQDQFGPPLGIVVSAVGGELIFFDLRDQSLRGSGELQGWVMACAATQTGNQLLVADNEELSLAIYHMPNLELESRLGVGGVPMDLKLNQSGLTTHMITRNGFYYRIALQDFEVDTLSIGQELRRLHMRPENDFQSWIISTGDATIRVIQELGLEELEPIYPPAAATDLCFTPDGEVCYAALPGAGIVWMFDADTRNAIDTYPFAGGPVDVDISPNGHYLAAADSSSGLLRIWDVGDGRSFDIQCGARVIKPTFAQTFECLYVLCPDENAVLRIDVSGDEPIVSDTIYCAPSPHAIDLWEQPWGLCSSA